MIRGRVFSSHGRWRTEPLDTPATSQYQNRPGWNQVPSLTRSPRNSGDQPGLGRKWPRNPGFPGSPGCEVWSPWVKAQIGRQDANPDSSERQHGKSLTLSNVEGAEIRASLWRRSRGRLVELKICVFHKPATLPLGELHRDTDIHTMDSRADKAVQSCALASGS